MTHPHKGSAGARICFHGDSAIQHDDFFVQPVAGRAQSKTQDPKETTDEEAGPRYLLPSSAADISAASSDENVAFLASNPELSAARNYAGASFSIAGSDGFATFSQNPELKSLEDYCGC